MKISLSDHFNVNKLLRFTLPSIIMMIVSSIYGIVDGFFVSNFVGKTPFTAVNFIMPFLMILGTGFFTALNDGLTSAAISFLRTVVFQVAAVLIFPLLWGIDGIWWSIVAAEFAAVAVFVIFLFAKRNRYHYM